MCVCLLTAFLCITCVLSVLRVCLFIDSVPVYYVCVCLLSSVPVYYVCVECITCVFVY